jgi:hypothetical protein
MASLIARGMARNSSWADPTDRYLALYDGLRASLS